MRSGAAGGPKRPAVRMPGERRPPNSGTRGARAVGGGHVKAAQPPPSSDGPAAPTGWRQPVAQPEVVAQARGNKFNKMLRARQEEQDASTMKLTLALHDAVAVGDLERTDLLLARGADVNGPDREGRTPLRNAVEPSIIKTLVNAGARGSNEMSVYVRDEQVYFGLLRLAFGTGRYRRTKWAFVSWSGEKMPFMRRGPAKMAEGAISALLRPFNLSFHFQ